MYTFEFDVDVSTHDLLRRGITVAARRQIRLLAENHTEAFMTAYAMAAVSMPNAVVTDIWDRI